MSVYESGITPQIVHNTGITLVTIALFFTICRLVVRICDGKLGWDDFWAAFSIPSSAIMLTGILMLLGPPPGVAVGSFTMIASYYMAAFGFYASVWSPRFSILCTILRIAPSYWRIYLRGIGLCFGAMWLFLFVQLLKHCEDVGDTWKHTTGQCELGKDIAITQLVIAGHADFHLADILTDLSLSLIPVRLLWQSNLSKAERIRLIVVFTSCLSTTIVSLVHAYYIFANIGLNEIYCAIWEASVSMIVACLTVLLGYASRLAKKYLPDSVTRTVWPTTNPSGFELATPNRGQAINVDITTTVWAEDQTVMYGKARPDEEQGKRFDDDLHGDQKTSDQALSRF
ncbi:hypothetical protein GGG16DRAFT_104405 [Schizophyllum commune]|nr:hypothetical protein K525DRAFT_248585 [Schizophyllum commune Loenen D]